MTMPSLILRLVRDGYLVPGVRLPSEREFADQLNVSRATLRETLAALRVMGIITIHHGVGVVVNDEPSLSQMLSSLAVTRLLAPRADTLRDLQAVRRLLECEAVTCAVREATEEEIAELTLKVVRMTRIKDPRAFVQADSEFHVALSRLSHNRVLAVVLELIRELLFDQMMAVVSQPGRLKTSVGQHLRIVQMLSARDVPGAISVVNEHLATYSGAEPKRAGHTSKAGTQALTPTFLAPNGNTQRPDAMVRR